MSGYENEYLCQLESGSRSGDVFKFHVTNRDWFEDVQRDTLQLMICSGMEKLY